MLGFPTVIVMDPEGEVIARTGYRPGGPEEYVKQLGDLVKTYENVVALKPQLEKAKGLDRAKLLDQLVNAYDKLGNESDDIAKWSAEIVTLDNANKAGLKPKYEFRVLMAEAVKLMAGKKFDEAKAAFDKALAVSPITPEQKQDACLAQSEAFFRLKDFAGLVACLKKAQEAVPNGPRATQIKQLLERFKDIGQMRETVAKIKAHLEKAKGIERTSCSTSWLTPRTNSTTAQLAESRPRNWRSCPRKSSHSTPTTRPDSSRSTRFALLWPTPWAWLRKERPWRLALSSISFWLRQTSPPTNFKSCSAPRGNCYLRAREAQKGLECLKGDQSGPPRPSCSRHYQHDSLL